MTRTIIVPPGETIKELMEINECTEDDLSELLQLTPEQVQQLLKGEYPITEEIAKWLSYLLNAPAQFWLNLEHNYRKQRRDENWRIHISSARLNCNWASSKRKFGLSPQARQS